jgi:hypothetical protein
MSTGVPVIPKIISSVDVFPCVRVHARFKAKQSLEEIIHFLPFPGHGIGTMYASFLMKGECVLKYGSNFELSHSNVAKSNPVNVISA